MSVKASLFGLAGAFAGAAHDDDSWPAEWYELIEYRDHLDRLATAWSI
jgi:hypothetical protein